MFFFEKSFSLYGIFINTAVSPQRPTFVVEPPLDPLFYQYSLSILSAKLGGGCNIKKKKLFVEVFCKNPILVFSRGMFYDLTLFTNHQNN